MEVEFNQLESSASLPKSTSNLNEHSQNLTSCKLNEPLESLINSLVNNHQVLCKSQQRDEVDITKEDKVKILLELFNKSKSSFLSRYGHHLNSDQITFFEQFTKDQEDGYEIKYHLKHLTEMHSKRKKHTHVRNRRFAALKRLEKDSYFSESEMMKRNPLLYEQLVGQYLSETEKKIRDRKGGVKSFVGILLDGIEMDQIEEKRKKQEKAENFVTQASDDDSTSSNESNGAQNMIICKPTMSEKQKPRETRTLWGEFKSQDEEQTPEPKPSFDGLISAQERKLLKEEFVTTMYNNFLDGKDEDFDYNEIDNNEDYDNIEILGHDEEEKYFDSEEPEEMQDDASIKIKEESSEDELDIYMNALNQHPSVIQLSEDIKKL